MSVAEIEGRMPPAGHMGGSFDLEFCRTADPLKTKSDEEIREEIQSYIYQHSMEI
jgi:hypothetical protein